MELPSAAPIAATPPPAAAAPPVAVAPAEPAPRALFPLPSAVAAPGESESDESPGGGPQARSLGPPAVDDEADRERPRGRDRADDGDRPGAGLPEAVDAPDSRRAVLAPPEGVAVADAGAELGAEAEPEVGAESESGAGAEPGAEPEPAAGAEPEPEPGPSRSRGPSRSPSGA